LNVGGKPIVGHILDRLIENGFDEATIVIGYLGEKIKEYVVRNYSIRVDFVEQEERLGLGHAIYLSRHTFSRDPILIILGDTVYDVDLKALMNSDSSVLGQGGRGPTALRRCGNRGGIHHQVGRKARSTEKQTGPGWYLLCPAAAYPG
jgi:NDP-sugar pyrophosphorylase family protein